jgi:hypothetical protein
MPDLYLHPDGDALLVDPQGKLTADPACCCGSYNAIVIALAVDTDPQAAIAFFCRTDASSFDFATAFFIGSKGAYNAVFLDVVYAAGANPVFQTATPQCHILESVQYPNFGVFFKPQLDFYIPVGSRVFRAVTHPNVVPSISYIAAHIYTARFDPSTLIVTGLRTLACIENPTPVQISPTRVAYEFPFTRP